MAREPVKIVRCPMERTAEALSLVLADIPPSQRRVYAGNLFEVEDPAEVSNEPLFVALCENTLVGAAWGQRQPGNFAVFWPPQLVNPDNRVAQQLAENVVRMLDATTIEMTQVLLSEEQEASLGILTQAGFRHLAELLYLTCESPHFPRDVVSDTELDFVPYHGTLHARLRRSIERTYEGTLDCTALNGVRDVDNVISGYQSTGVFRSENWLIVRAGGNDVGVLLLAEHPQARHWELMYMGLLAEARGKGWGRQITRHAQWLAGRAGVERIVLAVDAANEPAIALYRSTGFEVWDRRTVYVRFPGGGEAPHASR
jgi:ribosomal protein S18 acetylase RimI-like enzyme